MEKIGVIIGVLHNSIDTVLRDSSDQKQRQERITEVRLGRPKSYHVFVKTLSQMSEEERRTTRFGTLQLLWQEIPARLDLKGHVGNADDPGDGKVYSEHEIQRAGSVLKAFYDAWHEATIKANSANVVAPETLHRVKRLTNMARICLILRTMRLERLLDPICEHFKDDRHLPMERIMLERILGPDDAPHASTFVAEQYRAICRTWNDGQHLEIPEEEPLPLEYIEKYGEGSYGTVTKTRHAFTGMFYARKEQTESSNNFRRDISRLKKVSHRHIVQFVNSYQRGNKFGILLKPAATTDLHKFLIRYSRTGFNYYRDLTDGRRDRPTLKPIILTAFGCLSRGLAHIHDCSILHNNISPSSILYMKAFPPRSPSFLWAGFGHAYDIGFHLDESRIRTELRYQPRYRAPEPSRDVQAGKLRAKFDTGNSDDSDPDNGLPSFGKRDIFSFGVTFLEILSYLVAEGPEHEIVRGEFEGCMPVRENISDTQGWAEIQAQKLKSRNPKDPLVFLFQLGSEMISYDPEARPSTYQIVSRLKEASPVYFCTTCQQELEQYDLQQEDVSVKEGGNDREADQGSTYEENILEDLQHSQRSLGSKKEGSTVMSRGSQQGYDETLPDAEDPHDMQRSFKSHEEESPVMSRGLQHDYDEVLPDAEKGNNDDLTSLFSLQSFADSGYESLHDPELRDGADELTFLLLDDQQLQKLFTIIFRRSKAKERFVSKFRMLLRVFGTELKGEAREASHKDAAELARVSATYVATEIQKRYTMEKAIDDTSDGKRSARVATSLMKHMEISQPYRNSDVTEPYDYASDSEASDDVDDAIDEQVTDDQLPKTSLEKLKEFMICSQAFANLQNALRRMVYPDPLDAINDKISNAYELCPGKVSAVFNVHLDINNYLSSELDYQKSLQERSDLLSSVLTITGTASKAFATTAANYMRWKWPQSNFGLLETIELSVRGRGSSKLP